MVGVLRRTGAGTVGSGATTRSAHRSTEVGGFSLWAVNHALTVATSRRGERDRAALDTGQWWVSAMVDYSPFVA